MKKVKKAIKIPEFKCPICKTEVKVMMCVPDSTLRWFDFHDAVCRKCYEGIHEEKRGEMNVSNAIYGKRYKRTEKGEIVRDEFDNKILEDYLLPETFKSDKRKYPQRRIDQTDHEIDKKMLRIDLRLKLKKKEKERNKKLVGDVDGKKES